MTHSNNVSQNYAILFGICAAFAAVGSLLIIYAPILPVIAFLGVAIGVGAAELAVCVAKVPRGRMTWQYGVAGVVAGAAALSIITGAVAAIIIFLAYVSVVGYVVYWRLK